MKFSKVISAVLLSLLCAGCISAPKQLVVANSLHSSVSDAAVLAIENCLIDKKIKSIDTQPCIDAGKSIDEELDNTALALDAAYLAVKDGEQSESLLADIIRGLQVLEAVIFSQLTDEQLELFE